CFADKDCFADKESLMENQSYENQSYIDALMKDIVEPGVDRLMNCPFFSELRQGKLSRKRLQGFALQHYLSNHVINKGLAFSIAKEMIASNIATPWEREMVRAAARNMVRFKLAKFEGIYNEYA